MDANTPHFEIKEGPYAGRYEVPDAFTLGEQADIEEIAGLDVSPRSPRAILALLFIAVRRKHASAQLSDLRLLTNEQWDAHGKAAMPDPPALSLPVERNGDDEQHESAETHATGGSPLSSTSTDSSLGT